MGRTRRWIDPRTGLAWVVSTRAAPRSGPGAGGARERIVIFATIDGLWTTRVPLSKPLERLMDAELQRILDHAVESGGWLEGPDELRSDGSA